MLEKLRIWIQKLTSRDTSPDVPFRDIGEPARQNRDTLVASMREDVSRLQQELLALSNVADGHIDDARISALERQLNEKQQELAKFQGRI
jgi:hypothetical protein